ncbi:hypothetical protein V8E51_009678 [Hyaloscypha variabilis]
MSPTKQHRKGTTKTPNSKSFTCFPRLPPELRRLIWKHASFHSRDVDITASFDRYTLPRDLDFHSSPETFHYLSISLPPALLSTTSESRAEALKHYSLDFPSLSISKTPLTTGSTVSEDKPHVYVNWKVDRLCLVNWGLIARWTHAGRDFKERCSRNGLRFLACNLQGHFERRGREFLRNGVEVEEVAFFHSPVLLYERPRARRLRIEDRRMSQVGAYREIVDFVQADRRRREELESLGSEGGSSGSAVTPLVVKLVRLMQ